MNQSKRKSYIGYRFNESRDDSFCGLSPFSALSLVSYDSQIQHLEKVEVSGDYKWDINGLKGGDIKHLHSIECRRVLWEYGMWCAEQVRHLMTDPRSTNALDVRRRWLDGQATDEEMVTAQSEAGRATDLSRWGETFSQRSAESARILATRAAYFAAVGNGIDTQHCVLTALDYFAHAKFDEMVDAEFERSLRDAVL